MLPPSARCLGPACVGAGDDIPVIFAVPLDGSPEAFEYISNGAFSRDYATAASIRPQYDSTEGIAPHPNRTTKTDALTAQYGTGVGTGTNTGEYAGLAQHGM